MHTLTIIGRRWFQRTYGNTYHSAQVIVDGETVLSTGIHYGYGDSYLQTAADQLEKAGKLDPPRQQHRNGSSEPLWQWAERTGVKFTYSVSDVGREKDL